MLLLKLHGSVNWYARRGYSQPYAVDAVMHFDEWGQETDTTGFDQEALGLYLEPEPLIVPPLLMKTSLVEQPIFRIVWARAYEALARAKQVFFVGYSLPSTDIAAGFLFREGLRDLCKDQIRVIVKPRGASETKEIREAYGKIFPDINDNQFAFKDALDWSREMLTAHPELLFLYGEG